VRDPDQVSTRFQIPNRADLRVFGGYCVAAAVYIAIGVVVNDFMFSVAVAMVYIVVAAWLVPTLLRRLRSGRRQ
jgi:Flp pilus assembly protein TadB